MRSSFRGSGDGCSKGGVVAVGISGGAGRRSPVTPGEEGEEQASDRLFKWLGLRKLGLQFKCIYLEKRLYSSTATLSEIRCGFFLALTKKPSNESCRTLCLRTNFTDPGWWSASPTLCSYPAIDLTRRFYSQICRSECRTWGSVPSSLHAVIVWKNSRGMGNESALEN